MKKVVIIQRVYPNFREGFFDALSEEITYKLICHFKSKGKIVVPETLTDKKYLYRSFNFSIGGNYIIYPFLFFSLIKIHPDIIVSEGGQNTVNNIQILCYSKLLRVKNVIWDLGKGYDNNNKNKNILYKLYLKLYMWILRNSDQIITYNVLGGSYFSKLFPEKKIKVLGNTIDTNKIMKLIENNDGSKLYNMKIKYEAFSRIVLYVGNLNSHKNLESLLSIFEKLPKSYCLILVGGGNQEYIENLKNLFINISVFFEGYKKLEDISAYYKIADFTILPGLGGLSINQSMAFGRAVLCTSADGTERELVIDGETGYIYKSCQEAIDLIKSVSKEEWEKMGRNASCLINKNFSIKNMVSNFIQGIS